MDSKVVKKHSDLLTIEMFSYLFEELDELLWIDSFRLNHKGFQAYILTDATNQCLSPHSYTEIIYFYALVWRSPSFCAKSIESKDRLIKKNYLPTFFSHFVEQFIHLDEQWSIMFVIEVNLFLNLLNILELNPMLFIGPLQQRRRHFDLTKLPVKHLCSLLQR